MKALHSLSLIVVLSLFLPLNAFSQETSADGDIFTGLEEFLFNGALIVESTTKREERTQESSLNIRVITRKDIENYGLTDFKDLLMFIENGFETFKGRDRVFGVRGIVAYANDKIKFLIDGMEFPMELGLGEGQLPVTLDEVKRIEIVKGPNTSLYGGNATQATINIIRFTGDDFVGVKTGLAVGRWNHRRAFVHYAEKPAEDFNYDIYFLTGLQEGPDVEMIAWGGGNDAGTPYFQHSITNPLPDYELIASVNYSNLKMKYRRLITRVTRYNEIPTHDYTDAFAAEYTKKSAFGNDNLDAVFGIEASQFGNWYDIYHQADIYDSSIAWALEHKAEKRLEWDYHIYYQADNWDLLTGVSGNYWHAVGTEWGQVTWTTATTDLPSFYLAPDLTSGVSTPEWFPSFTEINDLANFEIWADFKHQVSDRMSYVLGGRYVYDFVPGDQLRDDDSIAKYNTDRELLRDFFPKVAVIYTPKENMYLKLIYQEGFNRPNAFEQFSAQKTIPTRGKLKATTAETYELVLDWVISKNMKTLVSVFSTKVEDFVNFAFTGPVWPAVDATKGQVRGFENVGERKLTGIEANYEIKYENYGGFIGVGYMLKNKVEPYDAYTVAVSGGTGTTGIVDPADDSNYNKQSYPKWDASIGAWMKVMENVTLSTLYSTHQDVQNNEDWTNNYYVRDINSWDIILNAKDVGIENLDLQLFVKNVLDADEYVASAMDPAHRQLQWPRYYEGKVTYLW